MLLPVRRLNKFRAASRVQRPLTGVVLLDVCIEDDQAGHQRGEAGAPAGRHSARESVGRRVGGS